MIAPGEFRHFRVIRRSITIAIASDTLGKLEGMGIVETVNST